MTSFIVFKSLHLIEYGVLFWLTQRALKPGFRERIFRLGRLSWRWEPALAALILIFLYGASDEFHQTLVPSREGKVRDVLIDGLGGWLVWQWQLRTGGHGKA